MHRLFDFKNVKISFKMKIIGKAHRDLLPAP